MSYAKIERRIWNDDKFPYMSIEAKFVFLHLLTSPHCTQLGCFKAGIGTLIDDARVPYEFYKKGMDELIQAKMIAYDEKYLVISIAKFLHYNPPANPNIGKHLAQLFNDLPDCQIKYNYYHEYYLCITNALPSHYHDITKLIKKPNKFIALETVTETVSQTVTQINSNNNSNNNSNSKKSIVELEIRPDKISHTKSVQIIFDFWRSKLNHPRAVLDGVRARAIQKALKLGYSEQQLCNAIEGCSFTAWNMGDNPDGKRYDALTLIFRNSEYIEKFIDSYFCPPKQKTKSDLLNAKNLDAAMKFLAKGKVHGEQ